MADYFPVLVRTVLSLDNNSPEARQALYERARELFATQLRECDPAMPVPIILHETQALEAAIRRAEAEWSSSRLGSDVEEAAPAIKIVSTILRGIACFVVLAIVFSIYIFAGARLSTSIFEYLVLLVILALTLGVIVRLHSFVWRLFARRGWLVFISSSP